MLTEAEWSDLLQGTFKLPCPEIAIKSTGLIDGASTTGQGSLIQQVGTGFAFSVTGTFTMPVGATLIGQTGRLTNLDATPPLRATDAYGREWVGEGVSSRASLGLDSSAVVSGRVRRLRAAVQTADARPLLRLLLPGSIRLPVANWKLKDEDAALTLTQLEGAVSVVVESTSPLPNGYDSRIEEALWFTFGELATAIAVERRIGSEVETVLCQPSFSGTVSAVGWPLLHPLPKTASALAQIFLRYLRYAKTGAEGSYHPTSAALRTVHTSMASTLEEGALVLSVVVEGFVSREHGEKGAVSSEAMQEVEAITDFVKRWKGNARIRDRILGFIGSMRHPSAGSALRLLSESGPILPRHLATWVAVRNGTVHGSSLEDKGKLFADSVELYQMLVFLILDKIGYSGPIADRTRDGWPPIEFPPVRERSADL